MSSAFQRTFQHLLVADSLLNNYPAPSPVSTSFILVLHILHSGGKSWFIHTLYILLAHRDNPNCWEALKSLASSCPILNPDILMTDFKQASFSPTFPGALIDGCHFHNSQAILRNVNNL